MFVFSWSKGRPGISRLSASFHPQLQRCSHGVCSCARFSPVRRAVLHCLGDWLMFALTLGILFDKEQVLSLSCLESCNLLFVSCLLRSFCPRNQDRAKAFPGFTAFLEDRRFLLICWRLSALSDVVSAGLPTVSETPLFLAVNSKWECSRLLSIEIESSCTTHSWFLLFQSQVSVPTVTAYVVISTAVASLREAGGPRSLSGFSGRQISTLFSLPSLSWGRTVC